MRLGRGEFVFVLIAALGSFVQTTDIIVVFGVKPNVTLALLTALSFCVKSPWAFALATGAGMAVLSGAGAGARELIVLAILLLAVFFLSVRLPGKAFANSAALAAAGTFFFYAGAAPEFLGRAFGAAAAEAAINGALAVAFFAVVRIVFREAYAEKIRATF